MASYNAELFQKIRSLLGAACRLKNLGLIIENERLEIENEDLRRQMAGFTAMMEATAAKLTSAIERFKAQINKDSSNSQVAK